MARPVLVTGAAGFIGRAVLRALAGTDWTAVPLVRAPAGLPGEAVLDLRELGRSRLAAELPPVEAVIHLGARIGWDGAARAVLVGSNVVATGVLAEWAAGRGAPFIYASAAIVCGTRTSSITAQTPAAPDTDYGWSKWMGEEVTLAAARRAAVLRIAGVFGLHGPQHLGLNRAIAGALAGQAPTLVGGGAARRNYIYVHDLAELIRRCLTEGITGRHLIAGSSVRTIAQMLQAVCDVLLPGTAPQQVAGPEAADQLVDPSPLLPARRSFEEALADIRREAR